MEIFLTIVLIAAALFVARFAVVKYLAAKAPVPTPGAPIPPVVAVPPVLPPGATTADQITSESR